MKDIAQQVEETSTSLNFNYLSMFMNFMYFLRQNSSERISMYVNGRTVILYIMSTLKIVAKCKMQNSITSLEN